MELHWRGRYSGGAGFGALWVYEEFVAGSSRTKKPRQLSIGARMNLELETQIDWDSEPLASLTHQLLSLWPETDDEQSWVDRQFQLLADAHVLRWVIPEQYGGRPVSPWDLNVGYQRLSGACLVTAFVLTQRNGACQRIAASENDDLKRELLPSLAAGEQFATVGVSHLTTSRQHLARPAVQIETSSGEFVLTGVVPWVTGAPQADWVVTGGTLADNSQALLAVPLDRPGIDLIPPTRLLALNGSQTGSIRLDGVRIPERFLLAGPVAEVMKQGVGGGTGSLTTSSLAVGLAARAINGLLSESEARKELNPIARAFERERCGLTRLIRTALTAESDQAVPTAAQIREQANSLVLRASQAYLAACKGLGFKHGHPASRLVREAMFFLVWSCPQPVVQANLREFACLSDGNLC